MTQSEEPDRLIWFLRGLADAKLKPCVPYTSIEEEKRWG